MRIFKGFYSSSYLSGLMASITFIPESFGRAGRVGSVVGFDEKRRGRGIVEKEVL